MTLLIGKVGALLCYNHSLLLDMSVKKQASLTVFRLVDGLNTAWRLAVLKEGLQTGHVG